MPYSGLGLERPAPEIRLLSFSIPVPVGVTKVLINFQIKSNKYLRYKCYRYGSTCHDDPPEYLWVFVVEVAHLTKIKITTTAKKTHPNNTNPCTGVAASVRSTECIHIEGLCIAIVGSGALNPLPLTNLPSLLMECDMPFMTLPPLLPFRKPF